MEIIIFVVLLILISSGVIGSWQFCVGVVIVFILLCIGIKNL